LLNLKTRDKGNPTYTLRPVKVPGSIKEVLKLPPKSLSQLKIPEVRKRRWGLLKEKLKRSPLQNP